MFFPFTKIESVFALFSSYILSKPYADWAEKYRKKSQSDTHFRTVGKICFPNAIIVADRFHVIRQAFWAMEQVRKNEQNKLSRGLRRYFKRSKHLLRKPMEALSSEEQERLALMVEIAPRLADAYRLKNEFLAVMHSEHPLWFTHREWEYNISRSCHRSHPSGFKIQRGGNHC